MKNVFNFLKYVLYHKIFRLKTVFPPELFPGLGQFKVTLFDYQSKYMDHYRIMTLPNDTALICFIIKYISAKRIFEIGTNLGVTTLQMAVNSEKEAKVYTLDFADEQFYSHHKNLYSKINGIDICKNDVGSHYRNTPYEKKIVSLRGDGITFDFSPYFQQMDIVYIDAGYDYLSLEAYSKNALKMIKEGGIILWHNYDDKACLDVNKYLWRLSKKIKILHMEETNLAMYIKSPSPSNN